MNEGDDGEDEDLITSLVVPLVEAATRLDVFLARALPQHSRSRLKALIDLERVTVDGKPQRGSLKLHGGERLVVVQPRPVSTELGAEDIPLSVVYEDEDVIVVDKTAGLVVHPGAGNPSGTLANAVLFHAPDISIGGESRPGIVHRLDKETSGVMVVAKNERAPRRLAEAFQARTVEKRYVAFCIGRPKLDRFELHTGHKRAEGDRRRYTTRVPPETTRLAHSRFTVTSSFGGASEVEVELFTGRTHQIRAQLSDAGHPLLQDELYGGGRAEKRVSPGPVRDAVTHLARHALHARLLTLSHPSTGERMTFTAPLPPDLQAVHEAIAGGAS